jgi:hypothetical protein
VHLSISHFVKTAVVAQLMENAMRMAATASMTLMAAPGDASQVNTKIALAKAFAVHPALAMQTGVRA